jgi:anti-sigma regulatory factor (Ser/Thr protein kinase)
MPTKLEARFNAGQEAPAAARGWLERVSTDLDPNVLDDIKLLVSELVTNSLRHAGIREQDHIAVTLTISSDRVNVRVCDQGIGFVPHPVVPTIYTSGGWGLYFVGRLSDRWGVSRDHATCVWFEVDRAPHTAKRTWKTSPSRTA